MYLNYKIINIMLVEQQIQNLELKNILIQMVQCGLKNINQLKYWK